MPDLLQRQESGIAMVTLNMPQRKNSLNERLLSLLIPLFEELESNSATRAVVLQARGEVFCNGMDIEALRSPDIDHSALEDMVLRYAHLLRLIDKAPVPTVAMVRGTVRGGGVGIVAACDIVLATPTASFELSELLFGLIPANVIPQLLQRLSPYRIRYMALTAQPISAQDAQLYGLVDRVIEDAQLEKQLRQLCRQLLRIKPNMVVPLKQSLAESSWNNPKYHRIPAAKDLLALLKEPEFHEAITRFYEGESPTWYQRFKAAQELVE